MDAANIKVTVTALGSRSDDYLTGFEDGSMAAVQAACAQADQEIERLRKELERAYRCIVGFHSAHRKGELLDKTPLAYHSLTIGAARRFVADGELDGADYFVGKKADVLHAALNL